VQDETGKKINKLADMPRLTKTAALAWVMGKVEILEWVLWKGKARFLLKEEGQYWSGTGQVRKQAISGRPSKVDRVSKLDFTRFVEGCKADGEGLREICRRLERFLNSPLESNSGGNSSPTSIGVAQKNIEGIKVSGGTTRRIVARLVMKRLIRRLENGLYVRNVDGPSSAAAPVIASEPPAPIVPEKVEPPAPSAPSDQAMFPRTLSICCGSDVKVVGGNEGTNHYECLKCRRACDVQVVQKPSEVVAPLRDVSSALNAAFAPGVPDAAPGVVPEPPPGPTCPTCKVRLGGDLVCPSCGVGFRIEGGRLALAI
jgi:hypothetical protein